MCLFCSFYIVLARASWRPAKKHAGRPSLLVFPRLIRVKEPRSPSSFPPCPGTVPGPKAGAKISQFFIPIQTFLQLFCEKIKHGNTTAWKTTGNRNVFSPAEHVHPGGVLRIPATKRPPTDTRVKEELPAVLENRDTEPMASKSQANNHAKAPGFHSATRQQPGTGRDAPRPHPHKAHSVCVHGALRACLRSTFASQPRQSRWIGRL